MQFVVCPKCFHDLDHIGLAQEIYSSIADQYLSEGQPIKINGKWAVIISFLEKKGYLVTHEINSGDIFAKPLVKNSETHTVFCRGKCH